MERQKSRDPLSPYQIFDLDGTLLDSMMVWRTIGADYLRGLGIQPPPDLHEITKEMSMMRSAVYFIERWGLPFSPEEIKEGFIRLMERRYREDLPLKEGAAAYLFRQKAAGAHLCVLTASEGPHVEDALARLGIGRLFDFVLTCGQAGMGKERPEIFALAAEKLGGIRENTLVFEDALHAVRSAQAGGWRVIGVYDEMAATDRPEIEAFCERYILSFAQL